MVQPEESVPASIRQMTKDSVEVKPSPDSHRNVVPVGRSQPNEEQKEAQNEIDPR